MKRRRTGQSPTNQTASTQSTQTRSTVPAISAKSAIPLETRILYWLFGFIDTIQFVLLEWWNIIIGYLTEVIYWILESDLAEIMALGLSRLWNSNSGSFRRHIEDSEDDDAGETVPLVEGLSQVIKRRRRKDGEVAVVGEIQYFPGMVNLSGTLCYMNSVLQALASIGSLVNHLERIHALAVDYDMLSTVTDALIDVIRELNTPKSRPPPAIRPTYLLQALHPLPAVRRLLGTREQQDAHELFLVLAEAVSDEALKIAIEVAKIRGLGEVLSLQGYANGTSYSSDGSEGGKMGNGKGMSKGKKDGLERRKKARGLAQPWEGLIARRRVCRRCGWCEAVRMDTLGGMELPVPLHGDTTLSSCIAEYLFPEHLSDVTCEMCSLRQTLTYYTTEADRLSQPPGPLSNGTTPTARSNSGSFGILENLSQEQNGPMTSSRKKRAKEARKLSNRLLEMVESQTPIGFGEANIPPNPSAGGGPIPIKWQLAKTESIREGIITRPPQSLRLHLVRSEYTPYGQLLKKTARVSFPLIMDLTSFVANGVWEEKGRSTGGVLGAIANGGEPIGKRVLYRLESAILHYGYNHSSGHYICIRRKPTIPSRGGEEGDALRPSSSRKSCPDGCGCEGCRYFGQVRNGPEEEGDGPGKGWLRISDADVEEVGTEALIEARGAVFMLFYEKVGEYVEPSGTALEIAGEKPIAAHL